MQAHSKSHFAIIQVPYTMAKFAVQGIAAEKMYASMGTSPSRMSTSGNVGVSLGSGVIAGVCAAIISHPADTLLSKINKKGENPWNVQDLILMLCSTGARWYLSFEDTWLGGTGQLNSSSTHRLLSEQVLVAMVVLLRACWTSRRRLVTWSSAPRAWVSSEPGQKLLVHVVSILT
jgi:hypothetical protein